MSKKSLILLLVAAASSVLVACPRVDTESYVTEDGIRLIAELATIEFHISEVVKNTVKAKIGNDNDTVILMGRGVVLGTIDLNGMNIEIDKEKKHATVALGKVNVRNPEFGENDFQVLYDSTAARWLNWGNVTQEMRNKWQNQLIKKIKDVAINGGIEAKTKDEAKKALGAFLKQLGYTSKITG